MRISATIAVLASGLAAFFAAPAWAQGPADCTARFAEDSVTITLLANDLGHDKFAIGDEDIRISSGPDPRENRACNTIVRISRLSSDQSFPDYTLTSAGRLVRPSPSEGVGGSSDLDVTVPASTAGRTLNFQATASTDWGILSGQFVERLQASLIDRSGVVIDRMAVNLVLQVPKTVDVMFVGAMGTGRTSTVNLGELSAAAPTESPPFGVRIWSSSPYSFAFVSENRGQLVHDMGMDQIPYRLVIDGLQQALDGTAAPMNGMQASGSGGDFYPLRLTVPARRSVAGNYADRITVSVTAL